MFHSKAKVYQQKVQEVFEGHGVTEETARNLTEELTKDLANCVNVDSLRKEESLVRLFEMEQRLMRKGNKVTLMRKVVAVRFWHYYLSSKDDMRVAWKECRLLWGKDKWDDIVKRSRKTCELYHAFPESIFFPISQAFLQKMPYKELEETIITLKDSNYKCNETIREMALRFVGVPV